MTATDNVRKMKPANLSGLVRTGTFDEANNTIEVVFATDALVLESMPDGERYYEQLEMSDMACDLTRLNSGGPVLDNHQHEQLDHQFGVVVRSWIDANTKEAVALVRLSKTDADKNKVDKIKDGIITNISTKYRRYSMLHSGAEKNGLAILKVSKWEPFEISFVTIPADYNAGTRSAKDEINDVFIKYNNSNTMTTEQKAARDAVFTTASRNLQLDDAFLQPLLDDNTLTEAAGLAKMVEEVGKRSAATPPPTPNASKAERQRAIDITDTCRKLGLSDVTVENGENFVTNLIGQNITLDAARALAIDKAAELDLNNKKPIAGMHNANLKPGSDLDKKRALAKEHAMAMRAGIQLLDADKKPIKYDADVYRGLSMKELLHDSMRERGFDPRNMSEKEQQMFAFDKMFALRSGTGQMSSSDFPNILENVLNKSALQRYQLAERTWEPLVRKRVARDFKPLSVVRLSSKEKVTEDAQILEGGEYTQIKLVDSKESYSVFKMGKMLLFSWEALINDDLGMFTDSTALVIDEFTQFQNRAFYKTLTSNTSYLLGANKLADGKLIFHADHGNLIGTGTTITLDALQAMRLALRKQTAPSGSALNLSPKYLIVGPELEQLAEQFTSTNFQAVESGKINKLGSTLSVIVDANITGKDWYVAASPSTIPTIEVANLEGQEMYMESQYSFEKDGFQTKIRTTYGIKAIDYRGLVKNPGI